MESALKSIKIISIRKKNGDTTQKSYLTEKNRTNLSAYGLPESVTGNIEVTLRKPVLFFMRKKCYNIII